jgi:hypothetical protein
MFVRVHWYDPGLHPELWSLSRGLYLYGHPDEEEILYIGKVDGTTVRRRWNRSAKEGFWNTLESNRKIYEHNILIGVIELEAGKRLTGELICDVESLLIIRIKPWGNIQCQNSRITRPGLRVLCKGDWAFRKKSFSD